MPYCKQRRQKGFTIQEMLLVILITVIFLSISMVGIVRYMRHLQLTELDNSAREIFLAAQNRAVLLSGGQRLESYVVDPNGHNRLDHVEAIPGSDEIAPITAYYLHSSDPNMEKLLPQGSIDPDLWDGDFYIIYEPKSGSVVDVFFTKETLPVEEEANFRSFYLKWRTAPKRERMSSKPMIGYYGGGSAEHVPVLSLRTPVINIFNENTLRAEITYWVPRTLVTIGEANHVQLTVTLNYQGHEQVLPPETAATVEPGLDYFAYTNTWILDSLDGKQFKDFYSGPGSTLTYGDDFTLKAEVSYTGELQVNGASKTAQDNSLFAKGSQGETAYITCLRHLQNLDTAFSEVADNKSRAEQQSDVLGVEGYTFQPIRNIPLQAYDGAGFSIYDLHVGSKENQAAGLFGVLNGTNRAPKELHNIRLVDTTVAGGSGPAGALVGRGSHLDLNNCQIYWENRSDQATNLRDVLGDSTNGLNYQITGAGPAGGLAGKLENTTLKDCSASTLVESEGAVGGLVGEGSALRLTGTYAASYLRGFSTAGLVGNLTGKATISSSYAVGFMDNGVDIPAQAAGLCLGTGNAQVTGAYSAMLFTEGKQMTNYPLCQSGVYDHTCYMASDRFAFVAGNETLAKPYSVLSNPDRWDELFGENTFAAKGAAHSYPYNLQTALALTTFIYPGLQQLDHWGDWGTEFQNGSLVYYERYADNSFGFSGGDVSHLSDKTVVEDGYAVAYQSTEPMGSVLQVTYQTDRGERTDQFTYGDGGDGEIYAVSDVTDTTGETFDYLLLPLPSEVVNTNYTTPDFYQKITVTDLDEHREESYSYSPHFANTVLPYEEEGNLGQLAKQLRVEVRSPRHLYMLSRFPDYYASGNQYRFLQQLDLDYPTYTAYDLFTGNWTQAPIGLSASSPFRGGYYGNCHIIRGVRTAVTDDNGRSYQYIGLFGYSTGVLRDMVYQMDEHTVPAISQSGSSSAVRYLGGLAGYNGGTVENCAVSGVHLQAYGYQYSKIYLGGLAGRNEGIIQSSAAEAAQVMAETNLSSAYAGGFVGHNTAGGIIRQCYAVGKVSVARARYGTVYACGFAGQNEAALSRSYAAVSLTAEGGSESYGFCPNDTTGCVYLNEGNFTYREEDYAAQYEDPAALPVTWEQLTGQEESEAVAALGMAKDTEAFDAAEPYPYPGTVKTQEGSAIHYGQWPNRMALGPMGVYYWEKLTIGGEPAYHFSVLSQVNGQVVRNNTLSTVHGDGGLVTEYGYGYFHQEGTVLPKLVSQDLYWNDELFDPQNEAAQQNSNAETDQALSDLMSGHYTFHSYNTWQADKQEGLHLAAKNVGSTEPPVGIWTLKQGASALTVKLNPFFANAMASETETLPGTKDNPYQVRSIDQLQFINWNGVTKNTKTVLIQENNTQFPALSYGNGGKLTQRAFYWEQTHDLDGKKQVYTPIAEFYDPTGRNQGGLFGWFGGTYDGQDYVIADVNIQGQTSSCVGLFGAVFDGTLKNIVLHSTDGTATAKGSNSGESRWYAVGGLAGVAGSQQGSAVVNCAVTGYTIQDTHQATKKGGWGGTGLGGLIGVSNMSLEGCTAVTKIRLDSNDNDNVRLGGLVGSCQGSISSCYAGGSIHIAETSAVFKNRGIYIGGIVGGIYMKPLSVGSSNITVGRSGQDLQNTLKNCYSYMTLPSASSNKYIKALYAVGGSGELNRFVSEDDPNHLNADHGWTNYRNNYYLSSVVLEENNGTMGINRTDIREQEVTGLTYAQMADSESADGLLHRLNANGGGFATVTTRTSGGESISGRYSFGSDPSLLGKDYPFPTILTQISRIAPGGLANVHYGDWPLAGIRRIYGALPVQLDLFGDDQQSDGGAVWTEPLTLSGVSGGGIWSVESAEDEIAEAVLEGTESDARTLKITAKTAGSTIVTVSYAIDGSTYTLPIEVNVSAQLRLVTPTDPILIFADESVSIPLELRNKDGAPLPEKLRKEITLSNLTVEFDPAYFTQAEIQQQDDALFLTAVSGTAEGTTQMTAGYDASYRGTVYPLTSALILRLVRPEIKLTPMEFFFTKDAQTPQIQHFTGEDGFTLTVDGQEKPVEQVFVTAWEEISAEFQKIIAAEWAKDETGAEQIGTVSITAYPQESYPVGAEVRVQFRFDWEGGSHTLWAKLPIQIQQVPEPGRETEPASGPDPDPNSEPEAEEAKP